MIKISLDESYAYDMLAIAGIKSDKNMNRRNKQADENYSRLCDEIEDQVGHGKHLGVICSKEFGHLSTVNEEMYNRIDEMKARGEQLGDATYIDSRVFARYQAKKALQDKWFPDSPLTEQKFGYDKA